jgi:hypothetical protein
MSNKTKPTKQTKKETKEIMNKITEIERHKLITYRWWRGDKKTIEPEHVEALEESAQNRIAEMMADGYTSGELNDNINMTDKDPYGGVEYSGYWEVKVVEPKEYKPEVPVSSETIRQINANLKCASFNCTCHAKAGKAEPSVSQDIIEALKSVSQDIIEALKHASFSYHHPACKWKGDYYNQPEKYCTCYVQKARAALEKINKV